MRAATLRILFLTDDIRDPELVERALALAGIPATIQAAETGDAFRRSLREVAPDLVLSNHCSARFTALHALAAIRASRPATPLILVMSAVDVPVMVESLKAGVEDCVLTNELGRLAPAVRSALALRQPLKRLTARQFEVLRLLVTGLTTRETARRLGVSAKTVETHRAAVIRRLGIHHLPGLVRYAVRIGLAAGGVTATDTARS